MVQIEKMLKEKTPFAVIQYFESFKFKRSETCRKYEIVYLNETKRVSCKLLNKRELNFFKENINSFDCVLKGIHGSVYEFSKFKEHKEEVTSGIYQPKH